MEKIHKMKIALITPYKNYAGGVESVNKILIDLFVVSGHTVKLITTDDYIYKNDDKNNWVTIYYCIQI